jgi:hypothetical protein
MPRRSSKGDVAQNALRVIEQAIGAELKPAAKTLSFPPRKKNPAAVAVRRLQENSGEEQGCLRRKIQLALLEAFDLNFKTAHYPN